MTDIELIVSEIMRIDGCEITKRRAVAVLRTQVGRRVYFAKRALSLPQKIQLADDLMRKMPRSEVAAALVDRLHISRSLAYQLMQKALDLRIVEQRNLSL